MVADQRVFLDGLSIRLTPQPPPPPFSSPPHAADVYRGVLQPGARVLDLCSSWDSHLPPEQQLGEVSGEGRSSVRMPAWRAGACWGRQKGVARQATHVWRSPVPPR